MNKPFIFIGGFVLGVAIGILSSRKHLSKRANEAFREMRKSYLKANGYSTYSLPKKVRYYTDAHLDEFVESKPKESQTANEKAKPFVIPPDEFTANPEYNVVALTLYSDGVVADEDDLELSDSDIENWIGKESLKHFGEFEEDCVYVQNDYTECYYEICYDGRCYTEVVGENPTLLRNYEEEARRYGGTT